MSDPLDNFLLRAYLDGEMDEATAQAFEIRMIEEPDLAELVDADYALGAGLKLAGVGTPMPAATPAPVPATAEVVALPARPRSPHARRLGRVVPWLAAAGVVLATGIGVGRMAQPSRAALEPVTLVNIDMNRSLGDDPAAGAIGELSEVSIPANGPVMLSVPVVAKQSCLARVQISQGDTALVAEARTVQNFANLVVDASHLAPGRTIVTVGCVGDKPVNYQMTFKRG